MHDDITDVPGALVGHDTLLEAGTGCTVVVCAWPAVGGVDVRGGAPGTRETRTCWTRRAWCPRSMLCCSPGGAPLGWMRRRA